MAKKYIILIIILTIIFPSCNKNDKLVDGDDSIDSVDNSPCPSSIFPEWSTSNYVLPYPVGKSYIIGLSACSNLYHAIGEPDQFAIDFNMPIGSEITASTAGTVVYVREDGMDYQHPNNYIVIYNGSAYVQYMHLTKDGAVVNIGDQINKGDLIGYSGATGYAGYPHLHFVVTTIDGWQYPYTSSPVTFSNTTENPGGLISGEVYLAEEY